MKYVIPVILIFRLCALEMTLVNIEGGVKEFVAGDILKARLEVSPGEDIEKISGLFEFLDKKELGQFSIINHRRDAEGDLELEVVLRDEVSNESDFYHIHKEIKVPIFLKGFRYKFVGFSPKVSIFDLGLAEKKELYYWLCLVLMIVAAGAIIIVRRRTKRGRVGKKDRLGKIAELLKHIQSRRQLELLYQKRRLWESCVDSSLRSDFYAILNRYQYKKNWSEEEFNEVYQTARKLRIIDYD